MPDEFPNDDYDTWFSGPQGPDGYVPHEHEGTEPESETPAETTEPAANDTEATEYSEAERMERGAQEAADLLGMDAANEQLGKQNDALRSAAGLLSNYRKRIRFQEPQPPFPKYAEMTPGGKAHWLLMLVTTKDGSYSTNVGEFAEAFEGLLREVIGHTGNPDDLSDDWKQALDDQLGIGQWLFDHQRHFKQEYGDNTNVPFSNQ